MIDATNLMSLGEFFSIPCSTIPTGHVNNGIVLRFKTFYLKVYNSDKENSFEIHGYRLWDVEAKFVYTIPYHQFEDFAKQITRDNYLDDPINVTWVH